MPNWVSFLPKLNAMINGTCTILLLLSLYFIDRKSVV
jgi:putative membrane protein